MAFVTPMLFQPFLSTFSLKNWSSTLCVIILISHKKKTQGNEQYLLLPGQIWLLTDDILPLLSKEEIQKKLKCVCLHYFYRCAKNQI